jgi:hypothetical protein
MEALNKAGLNQFLKMLTEKGWVNSNTGGALKAAVSKILSEVAAEQDVRGIDVDMEVRRFNNLNPGDLSPDSLATYGKRVKLAISNYISYVEDPTKYKPPGRPATNGNSAPKKTEKAVRNTSNDNVTDVAVLEPIPAPAPVQPRAETFIATEANLAMPFPLRPGYLAQVVIPRDMKKAEAARLCAFIMTLAVDE